MKAIILDAQHRAQGEKVAILSFDNVQEYLRLGDVANSLAIVATLEVRAYFSPQVMDVVVNALEAVGAEVDIRQPE